MSDMIHDEQRAADAAKASESTLIEGGERSEQTCWDNAHNWSAPWRADAK